MKRFRISPHNHDPCQPLDQFSRYIKDEARQDNARYFDLWKPVIVRYATPDTGDVGTFFPSYRTVITDLNARGDWASNAPDGRRTGEQKEWADDPLLLREEIYWQGDSRSDLDEMVTFSRNIWETNRGQSD